MSRSLLSSQDVLALRTEIDPRYETFAAARQHGGLTAMQALVPPGERFAATASSLTLGTILARDRIPTLLATLLAGSAAEWITNELGNRISCDTDQAWVRRQYAPNRYPAFHAPHGWHQDGALGFDFLAHAGVSLPADAILAMVTCWIALTPCGADAPGLELMTQRQESLLRPAELTNENVSGRFLPGDFWRPVLEPGDALLFRGDVLHRTHVTPAMTQDRTSLELRFFPDTPLPSRLKGDRFVRVE